MTTARDTPPPYQTTASAGGKLRKTPLRRRNIPATPYARPPTAIRNKNPNLLTKIVDPASRLLYAGASKLFGVVFGNRNLSLRPSETNEEPQNVPREEGQRGTSASISAATGISDLEQMLQKKTFTRFEIERLTALLHSRTNESSSAGVVERDGANQYSSPSVLRLESSTSGSRKKPGDERDNLHAAISTPMVTSRVFEEEIASPAELAKAYMGSRPTKEALRQELVLHSNTTGFLKSPNTSIAPKIANGSTGFENGFTTPRSRGRSAMYSMARTPYARSPLTFTQKGFTSSYGREEALISSQSAFQHGGKMALKRRSSVLDDDIGSGGPLRRTRQKANLLTLRDKRELGYTTPQQQDHTSQKLLLMNESEPKIVKEAEENRDTSMHGSGSGYANVPTKSTQTATKILQHLEKPYSKEKSPGSGKSPMKLTLDMLQGQALRSLENVESPKLLSYPDDNQKSEVQHHERLHGSRELTFNGKEKVDDSGPRKFPIPRNMMSSVDGELSVTSEDKAPAVRIDEPPLKLLAEPPQKKRAFQMSAPEDVSFEIDDDDDDKIQVNGNVSLPLVENNKQETALAADIVATSRLPGISRTHALVENNKQMFQEVVRVPEQAEPKESEMPESSSKIDVGFGGSVSEQGLGFKPSESPPLTKNIQNNFLPQATLQMDNVAPEKDSNPFPLFGASGDRVSPIAFSANGLSDGKPSASLDPKALESTSVSNSVTTNGHLNLLESSKVVNGNDQKSANIFGKVEFNKTKSGSHQQPANIFGKPESKDGNGKDQKAANIFGKLDAPVSTALPGTPTNGIFSFGTSTNNVSTTLNTTPLSNPTTFPSVVPFTASSATTSSLFNFSSANVSFTSIASTDTTTTGISTTTTPTPAAIFSTSTPTPVIPSSVPPPVFSFGSATSTTPTISVAETGNTNVTNDKDLKSNFTNSHFASTPFSTTTTTGSGLFGLSSPAVTSTTNNQSQASFFNDSKGSQAKTQAFVAVTPSVPFLFGSGTTSIPFSTTSGTSPFSSSAAAIGTSSSFGISSMTASSEGKSGNSTSGPATSVFGSTWEPAAKSSGFGTTFNFGASATPLSSATSSPVVFGASNTGGSTGFSFGAGAITSSFSTPTQNQFSFGNPTPVFGTPTPVFGTGATPNNNDHMSMDSMAEDSMQTPPVPAFGQTPVASPGFMFGSAAPTPTPTPTMPSFQFGGQPNQAPSQNPIPASASFQFGGQTNQTPPQNPFQSSSAEFNAGGGSFSLGSNGGDKSSRRIVRVRKTTGRKK